MALGLGLLLRLYMGIRIKKGSENVPFKKHHCIT